MSKRRYWIWVVLTVFATFLLSTKETMPTQAHHSPYNPSLTHTRKALIDQRVLVEELRSSAEELEEDADAMHKEICP